MGVGTPDGDEAKLDRRAGVDALIRQLTDAIAEQTERANRLEQRVIKLAQRLVFVIAAFGVTVTLSLAGGGYFLKQNNDRVNDIQNTRAVAIRTSCEQTNGIKDVARRLIGHDFSRLPKDLQAALTDQDCQHFIRRTVRPMG